MSVKKALGFISEADQTSLFAAFAASPRETRFSGFALAPPGAAGKTA
jgi:hypothetical protein